MRDFGQGRHDVAEPVRRVGEAVQQQHRRLARVSSLAEEHLEAIDVGLPVADFVDPLHCILLCVAAR
jgi:hypothetical protein